MNFIIAGFACYKEDAVKILGANFALIAILAVLAYLLIRIILSNRSALIKSILITLVIILMPIIWFIFDFALVPWGCNTFPMKFWEFD